MYIHRYIPSDTGLSYYTVQLRLLRMLLAYVTDVGFSVIGDIARLIDRDGLTGLTLI